MLEGVHLQYLANASLKCFGCKHHLSVTEPLGSFSRSGEGSRLLCTQRPRTHFGIVVFCSHFPSVFNSAVDSQSLLCFSSFHFNASNNSEDNVLPIASFRGGVSFMCFMSTQK